MILDFLLDKWIETGYPSVDDTKCLYLRNGRHCNNCADICPMEAISLNNNQLNIQKELCNGCGICTTVCPTQSIYMKTFTEENILRLSYEKNNPVFSCRLKGSEGNIGISCLNAIHAEFLATLFILYKEKKFYFNISRCKDCEVNLKPNVMDKSPIFIDSLNKALNFTKLLDIEPNYVLLSEEESIQNLCNEVISRRELFQLLRKSSTNVASNTLKSIISVENKLSMREYLLKVLKDKKLNIYVLNDFFNSFDVTNECNGCRQCEKVCPNHAWKIEEGQSTITISHNASMCFKCDICIDECPNKGIEKSIKANESILGYKIKMKIEQGICHSCGKKFIASSHTNEKCEICIKKEALRKKIAALTRRG